MNSVTTVRTVGSVKPDKPFDSMNSPVNQIVHRNQSLGFYDRNWSNGLCACCNNVSECLYIIIIIFKLKYKLWSI